MADFDEDEAQFKDIKNSFQDIPPNSYPLIITFHKFLMMLDGTLGNSYFERFLDATKLTHDQLQSSRSVALQTFIRTKEVKYERFNSSYWPHFNIQLTKKLDASRVQWSAAGGMWGRGYQIQKNFSTWHDGSARSITTLQDS
ncbi:hypothetical protein ACE6H2_002278 [Prunus campanulata]